MQTNSQLSRYEINRNIKRVLTRHAVDLLSLQFFCSGESVYFSGRLQKETDEEFSAGQIEAMVKELCAIPKVKNLQFDLNNWNLIYEPGYLSVRKKS